MIYVTKRFESRLVRVIRLDRLGRPLWDTICLSLRTTFTIFLCYFFSFVHAQNTEEHRPSLHESGEDIRIVLIQFGENEKAVERPVEVIDGYVIFEGDIIIGTEDDIFKEKSAVVLDFGYNRWDNSTIPYEIGAGYSAEDSNMIHYAINHIIENTNICMVLRSTETQWVKFEMSSGCSSWIGRRPVQNPPEAQTINLNPSCGVASTVHEIMHAAGFFHEQSRIDRDAYIEVQFDNIEAEKEHNFYQYTSFSGEDLGTYDYGSLMHYSPFAFSTNSGPTIEVKMPPGTALTNIGQRVGLSAGDISGVDSTYKAAPACSLIPNLPSNLTVKSLGNMTIDENAKTLSIEGVVVTNVGSTSTPAASIYMYYSQTIGNLIVFDEMTIPVLAPGATSTFYAGSSYNISGLTCNNYRFGVWIDPFEIIVDGTLTDNNPSWNLPNYSLRPTVTINKASGQSDTTNYSPILYDVKFSDAVSGFATGDVLLSGTAGATTATVSGSGTDYMISITGMSNNGTVIPRIESAEAQNQATGCDNLPSVGTDTILFNLTTPTVTINQSSTQADPSNSSSIDFDVVFSEVVTGFETGDVSLSGTANATTAIVSGSGTVYTVSVTGMSTDGTVIATIAANKAINAGGNNNAASTSTDQLVNYDKSSPSVTINQSVSQLDPSNSSNILFDVVFSESVTGFETGDVSLNGSANATIATVSGNGKNYTVSVSGMTVEGSVIASIASNKAIDSAGNINAVSTSTDQRVDYDETSPTVTINQSGSQGDPSNSSNILFDVVFSESVTGFETGDISLSGSANATTATVSGSGANYSISVSGMTGDGSIIASIAANKAIDSAGNSNAASTSSDQRVDYDKTLPTVSINQSSFQVDPSNSNTILFDVVFSESVTGFETGDVSLSGSANATTATVSGIGANYTVSVSGMTGDGSIITSIASNKAIDSAGNNNVASTSTDQIVSYDNTPPTVTINQSSSQVDPSNNSTILFDVVFSESVTGFETGDVSLSGSANATTATVSGNGANYTVSVSGMTGDGSIIASIAANKAIDSAGNNNVESSSSDGTVTFDAIRLPCTQEMLEVTKELMIMKSLPYDLWAINKLISNGIIEDGESYIFKAGESTSLNSDFEVEAGGALIISIATCE